MKRIWKHLLTFALLGILTQVTGRIVYADETEKIQSPGNTFVETYVNPLYEDTIEEADLLSGEDGLSLTPYSEPEYLDSVEQAGAQVREAMKQREENVVIYFKAPEYSKELLLEIGNAALVHTGNPGEGDYLKWQYAGWKTSTSYTEDDGMKYMTITYTMTYYTTHEQELAVDEKVDEVLTELNVAEKNDYDKICAVYDYICAHVVYDYDNLEDDNYKLKYTAYAALLDHKAVCQGYALLFYRMMLELDVDSRLIPGTGNGGAHGWNIVKLDGKYYDMDTTWDAGKEEYQYFLKCEENFGDHVREDDYKTEEFNTRYPMAEKDYEKTEHVHTYGEPAFVWTEDYSACTAELVCTTCEYAQKLECEITSESTEPTCETAGKTTYTAAAVFENQKYEDIKEVEIPAKGHSYKDGVCENCGQEDPTVETPVIQSVFSRAQTSVKVTINKIKNAYGYEIFRAVSPDAPEEQWTLVKTVKGTDVDKYTKEETVQYTNVGLEIGQTYYYKVRAFKLKSGSTDENEESSRIYSAFSEMKYMPAAVVFSNVYSNATNRVRLVWKEVKGSTGYQIWRMKDDGTYQIVKTLGDRNNVLTNNQGAVTAYSNTELKAGMTYTYRMRAFTVFEDGRKYFGAYSDEIQVPVQPETTELYVSSEKAGRAALTWSAADQASGYQVWMAAEEDGTYSIVKTIEDGDVTSYTKYGLESGNTYYFKIRAYVECGEKKAFGMYSAAKSVEIK